MGAIEIAAALAASRRAVRLYPPEHPTHREALRDLSHAVTASVDVRPLVLNVRNGRLYEGSDILAAATPATRALAEAMESRRVESLTFHSGFNDTDATGLSEVLSLRPSPDLQVQVELEAHGVRAVTVSELEDNSTREAEERDRRREADRSMYRRALAGLKNITTALTEGTEVDTSEATRTLGLLIERVAEEPSALTALAAMTGHGERSRFHAASVMLHSLVIGHALGLPDKELVALGFAGLVHDIGTMLPSELDDAAIAHAHPMAGAQALGALPEAHWSAVLVAFEHHMGADGSGWPERQQGYVTHPYSRIVAVANRYDNLTRPIEGRALRPDEAVAQLLREASGGPLDPIVTRLFAQTLGVIPVGCAVRLSDHSIAIVRAPGEDPLRPKVRLVLAPDGTHLRPVVDADLCEDERSIVDVVATRLLGMHPSDYL